MKATSPGPTHSVTRIGRIVRSSIRFGVVALAITGMLGIQACSLPDANGPREVAASQEPQHGGTLRLAYSSVSRTETLDPAAATVQGATRRATMIFDRLVERNEDTGELVPALAVDWEPNADATEWTFHLREDVTFHDGSEFTSADAAWTIRRLLNPELGSAITARLAPSLDASGISAPDAHTLVLTLTRSDAEIPDALSSFLTGIVKGGQSEFTPNNTAGTGPFVLKSFDPGVSWEATRYEDYWIDGRPYLDGIQLVAQSNQSTKVAAVTSGQADMTDDVSLAAAQSIKKAGKVALTSIPAYYYTVLNMDQSFAPFDDPRVREAVKLAVDRENVLQTVYHGFGVTVPDVPVIPSSPAFPTELGERPQDIARAKQLLVEAGYPNGIKLELYTSDVVQSMLDVAQLVANDVKAAGIDITIKQWPADTYWSEVWKSEPFFASNFRRRSPSQSMLFEFGKNGSFNESGFDADGKLEGMIQRALSIIDEEERNEVLGDAAAYIGGNSGVIVPAFYDLTFAMGLNVHGNMYEPFYWSNIWME